MTLFLVGMAIVVSASPTPLGPLKVILICLTRGRCYINVCTTTVRRGSSRVHRMTLVVQSIAREPITPTIIHTFVVICASVQNNFLPDFPFPPKFLVTTVWAVFVQEPSSRSGGTPRVQDISTHRKMASSSIPQTSLSTEIRRSQSARGLIASVPNMAHSLPQLGRLSLSAQFLPRTLIHQLTPATRITITCTRSSSHLMS
jgi:hypothetical protein